jgi:hypothetical protein
MPSIFSITLRTIRVGVLATLLALAGGTGRALAADQVAVVMRSSDIVRGALEDLANGTVYVRESLNNQRRLPLGSILLMDFAGGGQSLPEPELQDARGDDHLLVMRSGSRSRGRLLNIEGGEGSSKPDEPRIISFRTVDGEERRVRPGDVSRLYLGRYPPKATTLPGTVTQGGASGPAIEVAASRRWTATGVQVRQGDTVRFTASGRVQLSGDPNDAATPAGSTTGRHSPGAPLPGVLAGALVGRVGTSAPFGIGDQTQALSMPGSGEIFLAVNDGDVNDNSGAFRVEIVPVGGPRQRR